MQRKEDRGWNKTVREGGSERERKCLQPRGQEFGGLRRRGLGGMSEVGVRGEGANLMGFGFDHPRHESHRRILAKKFNHKKLTLAAAPKMRSQGAALKLQRAQRPWGPARRAGSDVEGPCFDADAAGPWPARARSGGGDRGKESWGSTPRTQLRDAAAGTKWAQGRRQDPSDPGSGCKPKSAGLAGGLNAGEKDEGRRTPRGVT